MRREEERRGKEREGGREGEEGARWREREERHRSRTNTGTNTSNISFQCRLTSPFSLLGLQTFVQYTV